MGASNSLIIVTISVIVQGRMDGGKSLTGEGLTLKPRFAEGARGSAEGVSKNLIFLL